MSDLSKPKECAEWVWDWEREIGANRFWGSRGGLECWIRKLDEMIGHFWREVAQSEATGRWCAHWKPDDVRSSLAMLREAHERAEIKLSQMPIE